MFCCFNRRLLFLAILGLAIPLTLCTRQPLVRTLLYNDSVLDTERIHSVLKERNNVTAWM